MILLRFHVALLEARHEARLMSSDLTPIVVIVLAPLVMVAFSKPAYDATVRAEELESTGGAFALTGAMVTFAFFVATFAGYSLYREYGWGTWERLVASKLPLSSLIIGKMLPWAATGLVQVLLLTAVSSALFGIRVEGSLIGAALLAVAVGLVVSSLAFVLFALLSSVYQLAAIGNLSAILLGGLGGAFAPVSSMPSWAQTLARGSPTYWAINGYREVFSGEGLLDVLPEVALLLGYSIGLTLVGIVVFDPGHQKSSWAN